MSVPKIGNNTNFDESDWRDDLELTARGMLAARSAGTMVWPAGLCIKIQPYPWCHPEPYWDCRQKELAIDSM
jgi:hypothetical protein